MLDREFYLRDVNLVAQELLGKLLVHKTPEGLCSGMIVETEAYSGMIDDGSHAYPNRQTERTRIMFGEGGFAYVYLIYGMYNCLNAVADTEGRPAAVLIRALEPIDGVEIMQLRRKCLRREDLANGPGKLCQAMGISREDYGADLTGKRLFIENYKSFAPQEIGVSPRINIDYAENSKDWLWRYYVLGKPFVSKVHKRYRTEQTLADL